MSHSCKVLVSIHDKTSGYTNLLVYDTMDAAKRDFEAQLERFREKDREDFKLCYYGMFDTESGAILTPSDDGDGQYATYPYTFLLYGDIPEFARTPVKAFIGGVEREFLYPTVFPYTLDIDKPDENVVKHDLESKVEKSW